jgi:hypothetical protein
MRNKNQKSLLFSTARPLFFRISAMVTTVDMAASKLNSFVSVD